METPIRIPDPAPVDTARGRIECAVFGDGPAVLALHGAMGGSDQSAILALTIGPAAFRYVAVSRPGYPGTPLALGRGPEAQADLCAALLDALGIGRAAVMAVSGGGPCALHFALRHGDRCRALVLVSTCAGKVTSPVPLAFRVTGRLAAIAPVGAWLSRRARARVLRDFDGAASRSVPDPVLRARLLADPEAGPLFRTLTLSTFDRMGQRFPGTANDIAVTRATEYPLERIAAPTLVIHGTEDRMLPIADHGERLASRIPRGELLALEGGGHAAIFTHRAEVLPRVARFLAAHAG
jgi:pimeloyl-ACP methyl ester carboxylesterase